jgi:hypothetical protein
MVGWAECGVHEKRAGTRYVELVFVFLHLGYETSVHIFSRSVGLVQIPQKAHRDTLRRTCGFASGGICGSRSAFWGVKC